MEVDAQFHGFASVSFSAATGAASSFFLFIWLTPIATPVKTDKLDKKGKPVIDLDAACPEGVARWTNKSDALDWLASVATLGIWSPRTVIIECAEVAR